MKKARVTLSCKNKNVALDFKSLWSLSLESNWSLSLETWLRKHHEWGPRRYGPQSHPWTQAVCPWIIPFTAAHQRHWLWAGPSLPLGIKDQSCSAFEAQRLKGRYRLKQLTGIRQYILYKNYREQRSKQNHTGPLENWFPYWSKNAPVCPKV